MIDLHAIRQANPLPPIVGASVKLQRTGNEFKACCPFHPDRSPSFTIFADGERFHCFGCGASGDVLDYVQRAHGIGLVDAANMLGSGRLAVATISRPAPAERTNRVGEALAIWDMSVPAARTPAEAYLASRGITLPLPPSVRFSRLPYGSSGLLPCLVASVQDAEDAVTGIQRTYLAGDGRGKAAVAKPKLSLGKVSGGAIRLGKLNGGSTITVCEGIEDGATLWQALSEPVWVAAGASMLPAMQFPACVRSIIIGADNDDAGAIAAQKAAKAFTDRGLSVRIIRPLEGFKDFNAELQGVEP